MLAYVFWHRGTGDDDVYAAALGAFHRALAADPPAGFRRSAAFALEAAAEAASPPPSRSVAPPWLPGDGPPYEDWYVVEDWAALGTLNAGAVSGSRRTPHDHVAVRTEKGAGAIYAPLGHDGDLAGDVATWAYKPAGVSYPDWHARLPGPAWQRQMVLGPAPEYAVLGPAPADGLAGARVVRRRAVAV